MTTVPAAQPHEDELHLLRRSLAARLEALLLVPGVAFDDALNNCSHKDLFPGASGMLQKTELLEMMRAAMIIGDRATVDYIASNLVTVSRVAVERDVTDPRLTIDIIKGMLDGCSPSLAGGSL